MEPAQSINFNIPKIKRQVSKDNLSEISLTSRDATELLGNVQRSYLDQNYSGTWRPKTIHLVSNKELEEDYRNKRLELKEDGRHPRDLVDQFVFLAVRDVNQITNIAKNGLCTLNLTVKSIGDNSSGVYVCRHADVQLHIAEHIFQQTTASLLVFKAILGKCKAVNEKAGAIEPTPNYDCHVSLQAAQPSDQPTIQVQRSLIYLYEYTDEAIPSKRPRQCLPFAVVTYEHLDDSSKQGKTLQSTSKYDTGKTNISVVSRPREQKSDSKRGNSKKMQNFHERKNIHTNKLSTGMMHGNRDMYNRIPMQNYGSGMHSSLAHNSVMQAANYSSTLQQPNFQMSVHSPPYPVSLKNPSSPVASNVSWNQNVQTNGSQAVVVHRSRKDPRVRQMSENQFSPADEESEKLHFNLMSSAGVSNMHGIHSRRVLLPTPNVMHENAGFENNDVGWPLPPFSQDVFAPEEDKGDGEPTVENYSPNSSFQAQGSAENADPSHGGTWHYDKSIGWYFLLPNEDEGKIKDSQTTEEAQPNILPDKDPITDWAESRDQMLQTLESEGGYDSEPDKKENEKYDACSHHAEGAGPMKNNNNGNCGVKLMASADNKDSSSCTNSGYLSLHDESIIREPTELKEATKKKYPRPTETFKERIDFTSDSLCTDDYVDFSLSGNPLKNNFTSGMQESDNRSVTSHRSESDPKAKDAAYVKNLVNELFKHGDIEELVANTQALLSHHKLENNVENNVLGVTANNTNCKLQCEQSSTLSKTNNTHTGNPVSLDLQKEYESYCKLIGMDVSPEDEMVKKSSEDNETVCCKTLINDLHKPKTESEEETQFPFSPSLDDDQSSDSSLKKSSTRWDQMSYKCQHPTSQEHLFNEHKDVEKIIKTDNSTDGFVKIVHKKGMAVRKSQRYSDFGGDPQRNEESNSSSDATIMPCDGSEDVGILDVPQICQVKEDGSSQTNNVSEERESKSLQISTCSTLAQHCCPTVSCSMPHVVARIPSLETAAEKIAKENISLEDVAKLLQIIKSQSDNNSHFKNVKKVEVGDAQKPKTEKGLNEALWSPDQPEKDNARENGEIEDITTEKEKCIDYTEMCNERDVDNLMKDKTLLQRTPLKIVITCNGDSTGENFKRLVEVVEVTKAHRQGDDDGGDVLKKEELDGESCQCDSEIADLEMSPAVGMKVQTIKDSETRQEPVTVVDSVCNVTPKQDNLSGNVCMQVTEQNAAGVDLHASKEQQDGCLDVGMVENGVTGNHGREELLSAMDSPLHWEETDKQNNGYLSDNTRLSDLLVGPVRRGAKANSKNARGQKRKKVDPSMAGYRKRRRRNRKRKKLDDVDSHSVASVGSLSVVGEGVNDEDADIDFNDFSFDQPQQFQVSIPDCANLSDNEGVPNPKEEMSISQKMVQKVPTLSDIGVTDWRDALNKSELQPIVFLTDCVKQITKCLHAQDIKSADVWSGMQEDLEKILKPNSLRTKHSRTLHQHTSAESELSATPGSKKRILEFRIPKLGVSRVEESKGCGLKQKRQAKEMETETKRGLHSLLRKEKQSSVRPQSCLLSSLLSELRDPRVCRYLAKKEVAVEKSSLLHKPKKVISWKTYTERMKSTQHMNRQPSKVRVKSNMFDTFEDLFPTEHSPSTATSQRPMADVMHFTSHPALSNHRGQEGGVRCISLANPGNVCNINNSTCTNDDYWKNPSGKKTFGNLHPISCSAKSFQSPDSAVAWPGCSSHVENNHQLNNGTRNGSCDVFGRISAAKPASSLFSAYSVDRPHTTAHETAQKWMNEISQLSQSKTPTPQPSVGIMQQLAQTVKHNENRIGEEKSALTYQRQKISSDAEYCAQEECMNLPNSDTFEPGKAIPVLQRGKSQSKSTHSSWSVKTAEKEWSHHQQLQFWRNRTEPARVPASWLSLMHDKVPVCTMSGVVNSRNHASVPNGWPQYSSGDIHKKEYHFHQSQVDKTASKQSNLVDWFADKLTPKAGKLTAQNQSLVGDDSHMKSVSSFLNTLSFSKGKTGGRNMESERQTSALHRDKTSDLWALAFHDQSSSSTELSKHSPLLDSENFNKNGHLSDSVDDESSQSDRTFQTVHSQNSLLPGSGVSKKQQTASRKDSETSKKDFMSNDKSAKKTDLHEVGFSGVTTKGEHKLCDEVLQSAEGSGKDSDIGKRKWIRKASILPTEDLDGDEDVTHRRAEKLALPLENVETEVRWIRLSSAPPKSEQLCEKKESSLNENSKSKTIDDDSAKSKSKMSNDVEETEISTTSVNNSESELEEGELPDDNDDDDEIQVPLAEQRKPLDEKASYTKHHSKYGRGGNWCSRRYGSSESWVGGSSRQCSFRDFRRNPERIVTLSYSRKVTPTLAQKSHGFKSVGDAWSQYLTSRDSKTDHHKGESFFESRKALKTKRMEKYEDSDFSCGREELAPGVSRKSKTGSKNSAEDYENLLKKTMDDLLDRPDEDLDEQNRKKCMSTLDDWLKLIVLPDSEEYQMVKKIIPYSLDTKFSTMSKQKRKKVRKRIKAQIDEYRKLRIGSDQSLLGSYADSFDLVGEEKKITELTLGMKYEEKAASDTTLSSPEDLSTSEELKWKKAQIDARVLRWLGDGEDDTGNSLYSPSDDDEDSQNSGDNESDSSDSETGSRDYKLRSALKQVEVDVNASKISGSGAAHHKVPHSLLLPEEKDSLFSNEGVFLILLSKIPRKSTERLVTLKEGLEHLDREISLVQKSGNLQKLQSLYLTRTGLHERRKCVLLSFTGTLNARRLKRLNSCKAKYERCLELVKRSPDAFRELKEDFIVKTTKAIKAHISMVKKILEMQDITQLGNMSVLPSQVISSSTALQMQGGRSQMMASQALPTSNVQMLQCGMNMTWNSNAATMPSNLTGTSSNFFSSNLQMMWNQYTNQ